MFKTDIRQYSEAMACANKVAGRELSGIRVLSSYFAANRSAVKVSLPLACCIDFLGYRLLAMSILPISPLTLRYGSADAGTDCNVHLSDPTLTALLNEMGTRLNLDQHRVRTKKNTAEVEIRTPVDLEGHKGFDGRYYLVDTSRLMPPVHSEGLESDKTRIFFENFRSEAMMQCLPPLSPDALSRFTSRQSPESTQLAEMQDKDILLATNFLLGEHLRESCRNLVRQAEANPFLDAFDLVAEIHSRGLNVRYLGLLVPQIMGSSPFLLNWIRCEAIARAIKNRVRSLLRNNFKDGGIATGSSNFQEIVAQFLDSCFCLPANPWTKEHGVWLAEHLVTFHHFSLIDAEKAVEFFHSETPLFVKGIRDVKSTTHSPISYILRLVCEYSGITLSPTVFEAIRSGQRHFDNRLLALTYMDVSLGSRVKHLPLIELCTGFILYQQGIAAQTGSILAKLDYLKRAHQAVSRGLHARPNDSALLTMEGDILAREMTIMKSQPGFGGVIQNVYMRCLLAYERAIEHDGDNIQAMIKLATIYADYGNTARAEDLFVTSLEVDSCDIDALRRYGDFISLNLNRPADAEPFYLRRQAILSAQQGVYKQMSKSHGDLPHFETGKK